MGRIDRLKKMRDSLAWNVDLDWLRQFKNVEKLMFLNRTIGRDIVRVHFDDEGYKRFIEWSYNDPMFCRQYKIWRMTGNKFDRPSLDHKIPLSRGGDWNMDNLQWMSWFENNSKSHMTPEEYKKIKKRYF